MVNGALLPCSGANTRIAIVASACEFPDASSPAELWQSVLDKRRSFRRIPAERLRMAEYLRCGDDDPDGLHPIEAALIEGYDFDRAAFRIPRSTFDATDLTHWLALDVATRALSSLPGWGRDERVCDATAVVVANTLTGEFSRAALMRGRWPFVSHCLHRALDNANPLPDARARIAADLEQIYKSAFPAPNEDSLAGGLSNTIAGRISNFHGLRGGAYTIDGACASSLLAVANACGLLCSGDASCAVVGGIDLSIDPFELIGFTRNGALARADMRVFDASSNGFWPGEGCGFIVLATEELAQQQGWPVLGWLRGWGISTDGHGGLTRPTAAGQRLALQRAYRRARLSPACVDYFEAHGTGTPTGDPIELRALADELAVGGTTRARPIGSIKANIGHTKAAAGMAGLLNALSVLTARVTPALAGLRQPHALLTNEDGVREYLRVLRDATPLEGKGPALAGVSGFGFGGVNAHVVLEGPSPMQVWNVPHAQPDCESLPGDLFLLSAPNRDLLDAHIGHLIDAVRTLSRAEMADLAASLAGQNPSTCRAYVIAETPQQLEAHLFALRDSLAAADAEDTGTTGPWHGWRASIKSAPRIAFVFSGQGQHVEADHAPWKRRLPHLAFDGERLNTLLQADLADTAVMQRLLAEIGIAGTGLMAATGITPSVCLGHSFGELSALHAAGVYDADTFRAIAQARGEIMRDAARSGAMVHVPLPQPEALMLAQRHGVDVACLNGQRSTVLSGAAERIAALLKDARTAGIEIVRLPASVAFHSREMQAAVEPFRRFMAGMPLRPMHCAVASTIAGDLLTSADIGELLASQIVSPVRLTDAAAQLDCIDLIIEVGAGELMSTLLSGLASAPCVTLDLFGRSLQPTLHTVAQAWVLGAKVRLNVFFDGRGVRPFDLARTRSFFSNPCDHESVARHVDAAEAMPAMAPPSAPASRIGVLPAVEDMMVTGPEAIEKRLRAALMSATGLPDSAIAADTRMLSDLHMNSLRVRHLVTQVARDLAITALPFELAELANAPLSKLVDYLHTLRCGAQPNPAQASPQGIAPWLRAFRIMWLPTDECVKDLDMPWPTSIAAIFHGRSWPEAALHDAPGDDSHAAARWHFFHACADFDATELPALLASVQQALRDERCAGLVFIQAQPRLDGFVRSLAKEQPRRAICLMTAPRLDGIVLRAAYALAYRHEGLVERRMTDSGALERPVLRAIHLGGDGPPTMPGPNDTVLITGGAKGIGAEVAQWFSRRGCRIGLIGRAAADDKQVRACLDQLREMNAIVAYASANLRDATETARAIDSLQAGLGPIVCVVHAAGINQPCPVERLEADELLRTVETKTTALCNILNALSASHDLKYLVGFGSIISEIGLPGESHYALANQWLNELVREWAQADDARNAWPLCWTAWRDAGMAVRLEGVLDELARSDTRALSTLEALHMLEAVLGIRGRGEPIVLSGRHGARLQPSALEALRYRFLETPRVFYPSVELIADAQVRADSDRYLNDHAPYGVRVFPLVFALEAMAQCACALMDRREAPVFEEVTIAQAITFSDDDAVTLRTRALARDDGSVMVDVQSSGTAFAVSHFQARITWRQEMLPDSERASEHAELQGEHMDAAAMYGNLFFHGPMFRAVERYREVRALSCRAELRAAGHPRWYSAFLPDRFAVGDPGLRDAIIHCLQACIPHFTVLPVSVERIELHPVAARSRLLVHGYETWRNDSEFLFDVEARDEDGHLVERWTGLKLRRVAPIVSRVEPMPARTLPTGLLAAFVERLSHQIESPISLRAGVDAGDGKRAQRRRRALNAVMGNDISPSQHVSLSHDDKLSLAVISSDYLVGCDFQRSVAYSEDEWAAILGAERMAAARALSRLLQEPLDLAALRVWTATETLIKLGRRDWPFHEEQWHGEHTDLGLTAVVHAGEIAIATSSFRLSGDDAPCVVAVGVLLPAVPSRRAPSIEPAAVIGGPP